MAGKSKRKLEMKVEQMFYANFRGVQVPIMEIPKIFKVGVTALEAGESDEVVLQRMTLFINSVRKN